jgi:hypothetical protein
MLKVVCDYCGSETETTNPKDFVLHEKTKEVVFKDKRVIVKVQVRTPDKSTPHICSNCAAAVVQSIK